MNPADITVCDTLIYPFLTFCSLSLSLSVRMACPLWQRAREGRTKTRNIHLKRLTPSIQLFHCKETRNQQTLLVLEYLQLHLPNSLLSHEEALFFIKSI